MGSDPVLEAHFQFWASNYYKFGAVLGYKSNEIGVHLYRDEYSKKSNRWVPMAKWIFLSKETFECLGEKRDEINREIALATKTMVEEKENMPEHFKTYYSMVLSETEKEQVRVELVARANMSPMVGIARFQKKEGNTNWWPTYASLFMSMHLWDTFFERIPAILTNLQLKYEMDKGEHLGLNAISIFLYTYYYYIHCTK